MEPESANAVTDDDAMSSASSSSSSAPSPRLYTLYFIRHAEALHNQLEKRAMSEALSASLSEGHGPGSERSKRAQEEARRAVLHNSSLSDPPLSEPGFEEARNAKAALEGLIEAGGLPGVEEVWASPLQRALQTAATVFPAPPSKGGPVVRVRKELEERRTGMACDRHSPVQEIRRRRTFRRFSLSSLMVEKFFKKSKGAFNAVGEDEDAVWEDKEDKTVEDKSMLRERTKKLFDMLAETDSRSICLIGHKGYLRELERGPLGKPEAELFKNCEVRVYRLRLDVDAAGNAEASGTNVVNVDLSSSATLQWANKVASSLNNGRGCVDMEALNRSVIA